MIRSLLFLLTLSFVGCTASKSSMSQKSNETITMDLFLQDAITEGLKRDKITTDLARQVASINRFYIPDCNVCKNVRKALQEYSGFSDESKMQGQAALLQKVANQDFDGKKSMILVVEAYIEQHFKNAKLSSNQIVAIKKELQAEAKNGSMLETNYIFCPSCTGADGACRTK